MKIYFSKVHTTVDSGTVVTDIIVPAIPDYVEALVVYSSNWKQGVNINPVRNTLRLSLICKYVNERFLGIHFELRGVTFSVIHIGSESLRHGLNECKGQQGYACI